MKMHLISALSLFSTFALQAQDLPQSAVPALVINTLQQQFQPPANVEWEKKGELYEAEFGRGTKDNHVWLDASGKVLKHSEEMKENELPAAVKSAITRQYGKSRLEDIDKIEESGKITYKMEVKNKTIKRKVLINQEGKVLEERMDD